MTVRIRPARNSHECAAVGEIFTQACSKLHWHRLVYSKVNPEEMKRYVTQLARIVRKTYHGIVVLAELEGKIVGYLMAWEVRSDCPDPYDHQSMVSKPIGKHKSLWQKLQSQIDNACDHVQKEVGSFLCKVIRRSVPFP
jgi:hypothetical protein